MLLWNTDTQRDHLSTGADTAGGGGVRGDTGFLKGGGGGGVRVTVKY